MQSESKKHEEETPSLHWGMDPVFSAFARLYIKDILEMKESKQVPGMYLHIMIVMHAELCLACVVPFIKGLQGASQTPVILRAPKLSDISVFSNSHNNRLYVK